MHFKLPDYSEPDFKSKAFTSGANADTKLVVQSGVAPENFHATTIFPEYFKINDHWTLVEKSRMDCVVVVKDDGSFQVKEFRNLIVGDRVIAVDNIDYRLEHAKKFNRVEAMNFNDYDNTGETIKEITRGGADVVIDCVGMDGEMSTIEKIETALKLQGGSKSALEIASQAVRKGGTVSVVGVYGARYNNFPFGDFFSRNITLKMGQCPAHSYIDHILDLLKKNKLDATDIITHRMSLSEGRKAYELFDQKLDNCIKVVLKPH